MASWLPQTQTCPLGFPKPGNAAEVSSSAIGSPKNPGIFTEASAAGLRRFRRLRELPTDSSKAQPKCRASEFPSRVYKAYRFHERFGDSEVQNHMTPVEPVRKHMASALFPCNTSKLCMFWTAQNKLHGNGLWLAPLVGRLFSIAKPGLRLRRFGHRARLCRRHSSQVARTWASMLTD